MKAICKVIDVAMGMYQDTKQKAVISLRSGGSLFDVTMFDQQVAANDHEKAIACIGKETELEINVDIYRNKVQFQLGFDNEFAPLYVKPPLAKPSQVGSKPDLDKKPS